MYGTLRGALAGRKIAFDRDASTATVEGRIAGIGNTIRIEAINAAKEVSRSRLDPNAEAALTLTCWAWPAHGRDYSGNREIHPATRRRVAHPRADRRRDVRRPLVAPGDPRDRQAGQAAADGNRFSEDRGAAG